MIFKSLFCKHDWTWHGWSYVRCQKCDKVKHNPQLNEKLQKEFWHKRVIEGDPVFGREAINEILKYRGRSI
jgi:hypothetical protein